MNVNSPLSIALGERIHSQYGSWAKARQAAEVRGGVYVLPRPEPAPAEGSAKPSFGANRKAPNAT
jgi:hypothetical protein